MRILLVSTYELGHQPLHVASPAAALTAAGHEVRCLDTSVQPWDREAAAWADGVAFSVPMHTAMRLALRAAKALRCARPDVSICLYGLYAPVSRDVTLGAVADRLIAGEYEPGLVAWAHSLNGAPEARRAGIAPDGVSQPRGAGSAINRASKARRAGIEADRVSEAARPAGIGLDGVLEPRRAVADRGSEPRGSSETDQAAEWREPGIQIEGVSQTGRVGIGTHRASEAGSAAIALDGAPQPREADSETDRVSEAGPRGIALDGLAQPRGTRSAIERVPETAPGIELGRSSFLPPRRDLLPPLERYARLAVDDEERLAGYVEASHGCAHECRHCPVPTVYGGRIRLVPRDVVLADVDSLVAMGARHITFGDPDFLNGWRHSLAVVRDLHERHPAVTFDCTTKVDHILERSSLWGELADAGCLFVVSALECVNDDILERLDKGHTTSQAKEAIALLRSHGIEMRPSFLPFTPWTSPQDVVDILDFVLEQDMIGNVDPVQYGIRLLIPEGSLLLAQPDLAPYLGGYDPELLTYTWSAADPAVDDLQAEVASIVKAGAESGAPVAATYLGVRAVATAAARRADGRGLEPDGCGDLTCDPAAIEMGSTEGRPRLTEPWFC